MRKVWIGVIIGVVAWISIGIMLQYYASLASLTSVDPNNCQIVVYDPETDTATYTGRYNEECLEFQKLPLSEQYEIAEKEKGLVNWFEKLFG